MEKTTPSLNMRKEYVDHAALSIDGTTGVPPIFRDDFILDHGISMIYTGPRQREGKKEGDP